MRSNSPGPGADGVIASTWITVYLYGIDLARFGLSMVASIHSPQSVKAPHHFCGREGVMGSSTSSLVLCALHLHGWVRSCTAPGVPPQGGVQLRRGELGPWLG